MGIREKVLGRYVDLTLSVCSIMVLADRHTHILSRALYAQATRHVAVIIVRKLFMLVTS